MNMDDIFGECPNLKYLDLSNFDFGNLNYFIFYLGNPKYINLYNSKNYEFINFFAPNKFILNQKTNIFAPQNAILTNCDTTKKPFKCESDNYIRVKFKDTVNYTSFFISDNITSRNGISYITYGDSIIGNIKEQDYSYGGEGDEGSGKNGGQLIIEANDSFEIYFSESISNLENFFNGEFDNNAKNIFYVDLSHFNSSLVNNANKMFYNCPNLEYLDLSNFNPSELSENDKMFDNLDNIKYIKLNNLKDNNLISQIKDSKLKEKNNLIVCQNSNIITNQNAFYDCLNFSENSIKSDSNNYISVIYNNNIEYKSGFKIDNCPTRIEIGYIIYQDTININQESLIIEANKTIEIHFINAITSLKDFFNCELDTFSSNIISIDFSHFNSSSITNIDNMLSKCTSLISLDISNFDFGKIESSESFSYLFTDLTNLKYINLSNVKNYDILKSSSELSTKNDLTICQDEEIINNENAKYICQIPYKNSSNYIIVYYGNDVVYKNGFSFNEEEDLNKYRKDIEFINIENNTFYSSNYLEIKAGSKVEINLLPSIESLAHFFDSNYDINMKNIVSIDFTNFNSSLIKEMNSLFKDCSALETIIISSFNTSLVYNISEMFSGCSNLKEIDLSFFDTSLLIDMLNIFYGFTNLEVIDLYNTTMEKLITAHNIFKNLNKMKYIDLISVENSYINITETELNRKDGLFVCQNENLISNLHALNKCCYYNTDNDICESDHFIILSYGKNITYESGFVIKNENNPEFRNNILFLVINRKKINNNEELNIIPNTKVEIHFPANTTTLENLFNFNYDKNVEYIEKINFIPFNSSTIKNMSHLFDGCKRLNSINFSNFETKFATDMSFMFSGCTSLSSLNLSNFNTELITNMSGMFSGCNSTELFNISNFDTKSVTNMSHIFSGCSSISSLNLSNFITKLTSDMSGMFSGCNSLESIDLSNFNTESATNMSNMFSECISITSFNLNNFNTEKVIDMSGIFSGCNSTKLFDLSKFNTKRVTNMTNMFSECKDIISLNLSNSNTESTIDMSRMFYGCDQFGDS